MSFANTSKPPYYAVIFTASMTNNLEEYIETAQKIRTLAEQQKGFLGMESAGEQFEITVSYWESLEAIQNWKQQTDHLMAQQKGKEKWYSKYKVQITKVERAYGFDSTNL